MPEFKVHMSTVSSFSITVEAEDYEAAIEKAYEAHSPSVCSQCSGWRQKWSLDIGDTFETDAVEQGGAEVYDAEETWTRKSTRPKLTK